MILSTSDLTYISQFLKKESLSEIDMLGFSMGGKVGMQFCLNQSYGRVRRLIVGDTSPVHHRSTDSHVPLIVDSLMHINLAKYTDRRQVDHDLKLKVPNDGERGFVLANLVQEGEKLRWRANLPIIYDNMPKIMSFPLQGSNFVNPTLFLKGGKSKLVDNGYLPQIKHLFPNFQVAEFTEQGHWLHEEDPVRFVKEVTEFLDK
jgi:esterase